MRHLPRILATLLLLAVSFAWLASYAVVPERPYVATEYAQRVPVREHAVLPSLSLVRGSLVFTRPEAEAPATLFAPPAREGEVGEFRERAHTLFTTTGETLASNWLTGRGRPPVAGDAVPTLLLHVWPFWVGAAGLAVWAWWRPIRAWVRSPAEPRRRRFDGHCLHCGYDLTGNRSNLCPECGARHGARNSTPVPPRPKADATGAGTAG